MTAVLSRRALLFTLGALIAAPSIARAQTPDIIWEATPGSGPVAFSPNGKSLAAGGALRIYATADGSVQRSFQRLRGSDIISAAFSPNGAYLAAGGSGTNLNLVVYRVSDGATLWLATGHANGTRGVAFSPDGTLLATSGQDKTTKLWRVSDGTLLRTFSDGFRMTSVAYSPDGTLIASGVSGAIHLWRVSDGALVRTVSTSLSSGVAFSPDGKTIANADGIYNVSTGALVKSFPWPYATGTAISVAFSRDGGKLITVGEDFQYPTLDRGALRVWSVGTGALLKSFTHATGTYVNAVAVSPDGSEVAYSFTDTVGGGTVLMHSPF